MVGVSNYIYVKIYIKQCILDDKNGDLAKMVSEEFSQLKEILVQIQNEV